MKKKLSVGTKENLKSLHVVSEDENAVRLIDYWYKKDTRGLIQMPFSKHWVMHLEACQRIKNKIHPYKKQYHTGYDFPNRRELTKNPVRGMKNEEKNY